MGTYTHKSQENKSQSVANMITQKSSGNDAFQFVDNRSEIIVQRKLQEMANNSPQVKQMRAIQVMTNSNSQPEPWAISSNRGIVFQRVLKASDDSTAADDFVDLVNKIFGGRYLLTTNGGLFRLKAGKSKKTISQEGKVLYNVLNKIINHADTTTIDFASKSLQTFIGQFETSQIDISDVEKFGVDVGFEQGPTAASMLVHELEEQFQGQVNGVQMGEEFIGNSGIPNENNEDDAHWNFAIPMEESAIGGYREGTSPKNYIDETDDYKQLIKYSYSSGRVVIVEYTVIGGNVENVNRTIYSSEEEFEASDQYLLQMDDEDVINAKKKDLQEEKAKLDEQLKSLKAKRKKTHVKKKLKTIARCIEELEFRLALIPKELEQVQAKIDRINESEAEESSLNDDDLSE